MKTAVKRLIRNESGQTLILALVLLVVGGLIAASLLGYIGTGLVSGEVYERKMTELYAADAGVEDAIWKIQNSVPDFYPYEYPEPLIVNDKSVDIVIDRENMGTGCNDTFSYQILSTATGTDGSSTTIEAYLYVAYLDLSTLLDNAIISYDTIELKGNSTVNGDIWLPDEENLDTDPNVTINGTVADEDDMTITWPTAEQLSSYYWEDVEHLEEEAYPDGYVMNIPGGTSEGDPYIIGPLLADGDLTIKGNGWIRLEGTIYVKGTLNFNPTPSINIDLNAQTIFAEGEIILNPGVTLYGSGCIIAIGDIDFQPSIASGEDDFVLVMSIEGETFFHPNGDFTGCIAGNAHVQLQPGCTVNWISPEGKGLDFPGAGDGDKLPPLTELSIYSWQID